MSEYLYGTVLKLKKTSHVFAQISSLNKKDFKQVYVVCLGENPDGVKEGDRVRVDGSIKESGEQKVMYASSVKVYEDKPDRKPRGDSESERVFKATVGNAVNVAFKWKGDVDDIKDVAKTVYLASLEVKDLVMKKYPEKNKIDIGMKVGAGLNHAVEFSEKDTNIDEIKENALRFIELQIYLEESLR